MSAVDAEIYLEGGAVMRLRLDELGVTKNDLGAVTKIRWTRTDDSDGDDILFVDLAKVLTVMYKPVSQ